MEAKCVNGVKQSGFRPNKTDKDKKKNKKTFFPETTASHDGGLMSGATDGSQ